MSDLLTTYTTFSAIDFRGLNTLSTYALSATPFLFVPDLPSDTLNKVLWSFGDGTTSDSICAFKSYDYPGEYTVNLFVYDCYGNVRVSSYSQDVTIVDLFPMTFTFNLSSGASYDALDFINSKITGPFTVKTQYPVYQKPVDVYYDVHVPTGDADYPLEVSYFKISSEKFEYLFKYNSFYEKIYNYSLSSYQYKEIDRIIPDITQVFGKLTDTGIEICPPTDVEAFFIGTSGIKEVYFKSDSPTDPSDPELSYIKLKFDNTELFSPFKYDETYVSYFNNLGITLSAYINLNTELNRVSVTSNGLDGEGFPISSFNISPIKFQNTKIAVMFRLKDDDGFTNKAPLNASNTLFQVISAGGGEVDPFYWSLTPILYTLSGVNSEDAYRSYIVFQNLTEPLSGIYLNVTMNYTLPIGGSSASGQSSLFTVYPDKYYDIYKKNETFNAEQTFKDLRFQEVLLDKHVLFEDFMGTIFGGASATYNELGKKIYEKIANFVENNVDIDRDEIFSLISQMQMMDNDTNIYDSTLMNYPEKLKRVLNLASISRNRLVGTPNKFKENFNPKGHTQKDEFGRNLGNQINTDTYTITAGTPIVALEKFSGDYTLLNTFQPVCAISAVQYQLSGYTSDWGWPLVLPSGFVYRDFPKYYFFFEYIDTIDGTNSDYTIDFANPMTTILSSVSNADLFKSFGIFENMIANTLYDSLSLFVA